MQQQLDRRRRPRGAGWIAWAALAGGAVALAAGLNAVEPTPIPAPVAEIAGNFGQTAAATTEPVSTFRAISATLAPNLQR